MHPFATLAATVGAIVLTTSALATAPRPAARAAKAAKPAKAAPAAPAPTETVELTPGQLEAANRVYTGVASCEFDQSVHVAPLDGKPGHFKLAYRKATYTLVPEETTTGAVRLEDRRAGIVWLQIPAKSMLMNSKIGQRMVDDCRHPDQRASAAPDGDAIGIAAQR